jgi:hypothetical protein
MQLRILEAPFSHEKAATFIRPNRSFVPFTLHFSSRTLNPSLQRPYCIMRFKWFYHRIIPFVPDWNHDEFVRLWTEDHDAAREMLRVAMTRRREIVAEQRKQNPPIPDTITLPPTWKSLKDGRHYLGPAAFVGGSKPVFLTLEPAGRHGHASSSGSNAVPSGVETAPSSPTLGSGRVQCQGLSGAESVSSVDSNPETNFPPTYTAPEIGSFTMHDVDFDSIMNHPNGPGILPDVVFPDGTVMSSTTNDLAWLEDYFKVPEAVQNFHDYLDLSGRAYGLHKTYHHLPNGDVVLKMSDNYKLKRNDVRCSLAYRERRWPITVHFLYL